MAEIVQVWNNQEFGADITATLYDNGLLDIVGSGSMTNFTSTASPVYNDSRVLSLSVGSGITTVGNYVFRGCSGLTSITIPSSVTSIGNYAFQNCSLDQLTISHNYSIGTSAFENNPFASGVHIEVDLTSVNTYPFNGCNLQDRLTFAEGITLIPNQIGYNAGLTSVIIPSSVTSIGSSAFRGCSGLTSITIPSSVTSVGSYAFQDCSLDQLTISHNYSIGISAFRSNPFASGVHIEVDLTSVNATPFHSCNLQDRLTFAEGITLIPNNIGYNAGITSVIIPSSVTSIGIVHSRVVQV
jgi:hypothetical protein